MGQLVHHGRRREADPSRPAHAFRDDRIDQSWAIQRAHWLAGRYWSLHGPPPDGMVPAPTSAEIAVDLREELEHLERHVAAGDTDPYEATYAVLNGSRILHSLETQDVAISKREAGAWALEHLPDRWHPLLQAAIRNYDGERVRKMSRCSPQAWRPSSPWSVMS